MASSGRLPRARGKLYAADHVSEMRAWARPRLVVCWIAIGVAALLLALQYPKLPETIPSYRTQLGAPAHELSKSPFSVFRIVMMGAGQLGAATAMAQSAIRAGLSGWSTFWVWAAAAATTKTLVESVQYALLGSEGARHLELPFMLLALLPAAAFGIFAARLWRAGRLGPSEKLHARSLLIVACFLAVWLVPAALPLWMESFASPKP